MQLTYYIVDAFINQDKPFSGNPAAVVILDNDNDISDEKKQSIAAEFNLAETVFVSKLVDADEEAQLLIRWFSPETEVQLCGHATVAASYILFTENTQYSSLVSASEPIKYRTKFGLNLQATFDGEYLTLNFPVNTPVPVQYDWIDSVKRAILGSDNSEQFVDGARLAPNRFLLLRLQDKADIGQVKPDFNRLLQLNVDNKLDAVLVTKKTDYIREGTHFVSRAFGPWIGISEDPVTGSSFTVLVPYWSNVYREQFGQEVDVFHALQASKRTGLVRSELVDNETRVLIAGKVNKFSKGSFRL